MKIAPRCTDESTCSLQPEPEWRLETQSVDYGAAMTEMEARNGAIADGAARELVWLLEHPHVYTAGTSARPEELLAPGQVPVHYTGRGGRFTYHGPDQRVGYVLLNLGQRGRDVRRFVHSLENWLIDALARCGVDAHPAEGRVGLWVDTDRGEAKIAAIGVRVRRWVTMHGFAINIAPDLARFGGIVPCGLPDYPVTSLADLGLSASMTDVDAALRQGFPAFLSALSTPPRSSTGDDGKHEKNCV